MTTTPKLLTTAEIKFLNTQPIVTQNGQNQIYFNPVALHDFDSTVVTPGLFLGFEKISEKEVVLHHLDTYVDGAVRLRRSKSKRTGSCSFGPVLADTPFLRVVPGRQNHYRYRIDTLADGKHQFVLLIAKPKVVAVAPRTKKATTARKKAAKRSPAEGAGEAK